MFGLSVEKLVLVAICAAVIIGPHRLPEYVRRLSAIVRQLTVLAAEARRRAEEETGAVLARKDWQAIDPRRYDPRRIVREAWEEADAAPATAEAASTSPPSGRWVVSGSSAHPRRVWVPDEDAIPAASS